GRVPGEPRGPDRRLRARGRRAVQPIRHPAADTCRHHRRSRLPGGARLLPRASRRPAGGT
ncbi:MAG: hypothetical protein AVDCRST_MAG79-463, partial [uncultured Thermoleophilia bacterium]